MSIHKITWQGNVFGDIEIEANSAQEAKEKLKEITLIKLVQSSKIWNNDKPVQIEGVDTDYGFVDQRTWELLEDG